MNEPHIHAALIHAWADGAEIEFWSRGLGAWPVAGSWRAEVNPCWFKENSYRIKPEPIKDYIVYQYVAKMFRNGWVSDSRHSIPPDNNVKLTFDGETGRLKDVEMLK